MDMVPHGETRRDCELFAGVRGQPATTVSGIMLNVQNHSRWARSWLTALQVGRSCGIVRVYWCEGSHVGASSAQWTQVAERDAPVDDNDDDWLSLSTTVSLLPGCSCGLYIHAADLASCSCSAALNGIAAEDGVLRIHTGRAQQQVAPPFASPWSSGPCAFFGMIRYLRERPSWSPATHLFAPTDFRRVVVALLCAARRKDCLLAQLPSDVLQQVIALTFGTAWRSYYVASTPPLVNQGPRPLILRERLQRLVKAAGEKCVNRGFPPRERSQEETMMRALQLM